MRAYAISGRTVTFDPATGYSNSRQLPTFYLLANVQGIVSEDHATEIAYNLFDHGNRHQTTWLTAVETDIN